MQAPTSKPTSPGKTAPVSPGSKPRANPAAPSASHLHKQFEITTSIERRGKRVVFYAPGGWGKTSISAMAPGAVILDLERRTEEVAKKLAVHNWPLKRISTIGENKAAVNPEDFINAAQGFADTRHALHNFQLWQPGSTIIIDSLTKLEEWCWRWVVENIKGEKGATVTEIEGYGYGKGYTYGFEQMCKVLQDLDVLTARGVNCILICHDCIANFNDPAQVGEFKRYEPRLYRSGSGNTDTRLRVREWADAVLFGTYDMTREKDGMVKGNGTRVIYTQERPAFMAKSSLDGVKQFQIPVQHEFDDTIWKLIFGEAA